MNRARTSTVYDWYSYAGDYPPWMYGGAPDECSIHWPTKYDKHGECPECKEYAVNRARTSLNDDDRAEWINNDEYLYSLWQASRRGITAFVRENRAWIDAYILPVLNAEPTR